MEVSVLEATPNPIETISLCAGVSYKKENVSSKRVETCIKNGHWSVIEFAHIVFKIEGVSRALTHQLVRHRLNSFIQESQRYVRYKDLLDTDDWYVTPPEIASDPSLKTAFDSNMRLAAITYETLLDEGVKPEDARYVLPNAAKTNINVGMNARSLFNFLDLRLDSHSQWEIRELANNMVRAARQQGEEWNQLLDYYFQTKV